MSAVRELGHHVTCAKICCKQRANVVPRRQLVATMTTGEPMRAAFQAAHPAKQGLYDPRYEHDACGVGFVATLTGEASHELVERALTVLRNLEHRGATGSDPDTGDGA